jgi:spermidine synthase
MAIGYVMIPLLPNSVTMSITAAALILVCAGYFLLYRRKATAVTTALILAAAVPIVIGYQYRQRHYEWVVELFRGNSQFGQLQVVDTPRSTCRFYLNDNLIQNTYDPATKRSESSFTYLLAGLARAYTTNITDVLCIGLGVGIVPMDFANHGARVDVVEINPAIVPVAARFFDLQTNELHITIDDGRHYLNRCRKRYDVVVLDAFLGDSSPSHLLTREAFTSIRNVLRPGGTLVINSFGDLETGRDFFTASLNKTLSAVFRGVRIHTSGNGGVFFVATDRTEPTFVHTPDLNDIHPEARRDTDAAFVGLVETNPNDGRVLTDDFNPVEFYDAKNREEIRRRLARNAREM